MKFTHSKKSTQRNWTKVILIAVLCVFVVSGAVFYGANRWYTQNLRAVSTSTEEQVVVIEPGSSTDEIATQLADAGLIRNASAFNWYVDRLDDSRFLQAGTYTMSPSLSVEEIVEILLAGRVNTSLVTIPPGLRLDQIKAALVSAGFDAAEIDAAFANPPAHPLLEEKPPAASLEGYIFPETYQITEKTTVDSLLTQAFSVFSERIDASITQGIARQGLSLHEAIILASIVQEEVSGPDEQKTVAQVFLRRLDENFPLGADPTFRYAAYLLGVEETPDIVSPYNTRNVTGLPPGPIANFNLSALQAVAEPDTTNYLYFVSGDDGITRFSNTLEEHEAKTREFCVELCKL